MWMFNASRKSGQEHTREPSHGNHQLMSQPLFEVVVSQNEGEVVVTESAKKRKGKAAMK